MKSSINKNIYYRIIESKKTTSNNVLNVKYCNSKTNRIGFVLRRSFGSAPKRNLFKRRCRQALMNCNKSYSMIVRPKKNTNIKYNEILQLFNNIGSS